MSPERTSLRPRLLLLDVLLAFTLALEMELETRLGSGLSPTHRLITIVAVVFYAAPVACRRRWPLAALVACATVAALQAPLGGNIVGGMTGSLLPPMALGYWAGTARGVSRGLPAIAAAVALLDFGVYVSNQVTPSNNYGSLGGDLIGFALAASVPWGVGRMMVERAERARAFSELSSRLDHQRRANESRAIAEERVRIGRELQDLVAQGISAMVIQAGGARQLIRSGPDRACESVQAIEVAGRDALTELRRAVMLLHPIDDTIALVPRPGLGQLGGLVTAMSENGIACTLDTAGSTTPIAVGADLLAYRLVEAALGVAKEHRASEVNVVAVHRGARLELRVKSDVSAEDIAEQLADINERLALYDGTMRASPGGYNTGFSVEAQLPVRGALQ